jgi:hypothetical protein
MKKLHFFNEREKKRFLENTIKEPPFIIGLLLIIFVVFIIPGFKNINIHDHYVYSFKLNNVAYTLTPLTINTELGNIYLKRFAKIQIRTLTNSSRGLIKIESGVFEHNLILFNEKLINIHTINFSPGAVITFDLLGQYIIIDGRQRNVIGIVFSKIGGNVRLILRSDQISNILVSLSGDIIEPEERGTNIFYEYYRF